jgi:hypothetical protein
VVTRLSLKWLMDALGKLSEPAAEGGGTSQPQP